MSEATHMTLEGEVTHPRQEVALLRGALEIALEEGCEARGGCSDRLHNEERVRLGLPVLSVEEVSRASY